MYVQISSMYYPLKLFLFSLRKELLNTLTFIKNWFKKIAEQNTTPLQKTPTYCMETRYRVNKKHIATKSGRKLSLFPHEKFISVFYAINIFNTIYYIQPTNFNCA